MTAALIVLPAARVELIAAQDWYEQASPGLGATFRSEVDRQIGRVLENPRQFPVVLRGLFFRERGEAIYLIACFHGSRDPLVWQSRR